MYVNYNFKEIFYYKLEINKVTVATKNLDRQTKVLCRNIIIKYFSKALHI